MANWNLVQAIELNTNIAIKKNRNTEKLHIFSYGVFVSSNWAYRKNQQLNSSGIQKQCEAHLNSGFRHN